MSDNVPVASRPTERELDLELVKLVDWQVFATHLPGLERENIEEIQRNNHEVRLQKLELFGTWLRIQPDASWKDVVLALEKARENTLAEAVKRKSIPVQDTASTMRVYESHQIQHTSNEKVFLPIAVDEVQKTNDSTEHLKVEERKLEADEIAIQLVGLHKRFAQMEANIKCALESIINDGQKAILYIARYLERHLEDEQLILTDSKDIDDLFHKLHSYYSFLDCELLEEIVEQFVQGDAQTKFKEYVTDVEAFEELTTLQELKDAIEQALLPTQSVTPSTCEVILKVNNRWKKEKMKCLNKLLEHVFFEKHHLLKHIRITVGSMCIRFLVPKSQVEMLIALAAKHKEFMYLLGVFEMMINDIPVLMEDENMSFAFDSALLESSQSGNNEAVQFLLDLGVNINYSNSEGKTALMLACQAGHEEVVQTLVSGGTNVNLQDNAGKTALMVSKTKEIFSLLLQSNADINILTHRRSTPLIAACALGHLSVVEMLLVEYNNNPNVQNKKGCTALILTSQNGHYQVVEILLKNDADPNIHDNDGWTALILSSDNGHQQVVELLLEKQVDPNVQNSKNGSTALIQASQEGHYQVVEILLKNDADPNIHDNNGHTALMVASMGGNSDIIEVLLRHNANPHYFVTSEGVSFDSFACAAANGNIECVNIFLKHTELSLKRLLIGWYCACYYGNVPVIRLLSNRLDIVSDQRDLIISCAEGDLGSVVDQLMSGKITPDAEFVHGVTPIMISSSCGHTDIIEALITTGANVNKTDEFGHTALDFTEAAQQDATMNILLQHGGINGPGPESECDKEKTTSEEQKLSTDASQSNIKSSQDSLSIRKKELNTKNRSFIILKKLFKDTVKYSQSIFSPYQRFDNREYSTTTHIPQPNHFI